MIPGLVTGLGAGAAGLFVGLGATLLVVRLRARGVRVPYTRKVFHFAVFSGAAVVQMAWGLPGTNTYGGIVALLVVVAVLRGDRSGLYGALARDTDRPRRSFFIVLPLITTALGGLGSALVAGRYAAVGYLVAGWGDAVAEPVGARWGRHPYRVPSLLGVPARRTWEGSAAVFLVGWCGATLGLMALGNDGLTAAGVGGVVALASSVVEAVSHHGADNLTVQLAASLVARWLLSG